MLVWSTQYVVLTAGFRSVSNVGMVSDRCHIKYVIKANSCHEEYRDLLVITH